MSQKEWTLEVFFITGDIRSGMSVKSRYEDYMAKKNIKKIKKSKKTEKIREVITTKCQDI